MGLLDHYRQFEAMTAEEVNALKRDEATERRRAALERVPPLDLAQTTWPSPPHPAVVNAVTFAARRGLNRYPGAVSRELRSELAHRHGWPEERIAVGHGAAQLLGAAIHHLISAGQELITPWPSYPLYPLLARRAGGRAVPVADGDIDAILAAVNDRTRVIALAQPNDPTGALLDVAALDRLVAALPDGIAVLLDEAPIEFAGAARERASVSLLDAHHRVLVFRSFSKAWGLAGLRCGYVVGAPGTEELLAELAPDLGVHELALVGALEALRSASGDVRARVRAIARERERLTRELRALGFDVPSSRANFLWVAHPRLGDGALLDALGRASILVAPGAALGAGDRVRIAVRDRAASERLLRALEGALGG